MLTQVRRSLWRFRSRYRLANGVWETIRGRKHPIFLEFPIAPRPRYGYGEHPPHQRLLELFARRDEVYREHLRSFLDFAEQFAEMAVTPEGAGEGEAAWMNGSLPALDAIALYGFLARHDPATYLEIGYGNSTKFARRAIVDHGLRTRIVAVDPYTKQGCEQHCDEIIHEHMQDLDPEIFRRLAPGDILFVDGSHWVFQNSDVVVFFMDVLPELPAGVWVHIHDITLPSDYGPDFVDRYWSEQYMLAAWLLGGGDRMEIQLPNHYLWRDSQLVRELDPLVGTAIPGEVPMTGSSFWFTTGAA